jgi:hypothetical protein
MKLQGKITEFDGLTRKGIIEDSSGTKHLIQPGSFRRTVNLKQGATVQFQSFNLSNGPTAQDIEPDLTQGFEYFQTDLPR